jgi:WD40 repeat protein
MCGLILCCRRIHDLETSALLHTDNSHSNEINSLQFDDSVVCTSSDDCTVRLFDVRDPHAQIAVMKGHPGSVYHLQFDDTKIISCDNQGTVCVNCQAPVLYLVLRRDGSGHHMGSPHA